MRIPIRLKLAGALAVPLLALIGVSTYEVVQAGAEADDAKSETELALASVGPNSLISNLQNERNMTGLTLLGLEAAVDLPVDDIAGARAATDAAIVELEEFVANGSPELAAVFANGLAAVNSGLATVRGDVDTFMAANPPGLTNDEFANEMFSTYTESIRVLLDDTISLAYRIDDADLRTGVEIIGLSTLAYENGTNVVRGILLAEITNDRELDTRLDLARLNAITDRIDQEMLARSIGPFEGIPESFLLTDEQLAQDQLLKTFENTGSVDIQQMLGATQADESAGTLGLRADITNVTSGIADEILSSANQRQDAVFILSSLAVGAALVIFVLATYSITSPLRSLTRQARHMATDRLPKAVQSVLDTPLGEDVVVPKVPRIKVRTRDEVADVAAALNTVQGSALDLAVEQAALRKNIADSFVNLGRRNQNLLDRQLDFITDLERQEQDAERLEGLFRLDHLATRMRRNAESLLRLAGGGDTTQAGWGGPVPVVDVVRGALGEVEDYQRVDVRALQPATVSGGTAADLAHIIAELVENGLTFSPPHERIEVRGRRSERGYTIAIIDQGVGMNEEQLETANRRLAGRESFTVAPSRYLGHYVAGHLAATHGIEIRLTSTAAGGVTARIDVPNSVLVDGPTGNGGLVVEQNDADIDLADEPILEDLRAPAPAPVEPEPVVAGEPYEPYEPYVAEPVAPVADLPVLPDLPVAPAPVDDAPPLGGSGRLATRSAGRSELSPEPPAAPAPAPRAPQAPSAPVLQTVGSAPATNGGPGGLTRRVRGANAPKATNVAAAFGGGAPAKQAGPASADDVASFLAAFSGGVERGLAETHTEHEEEQ